ncbi:MAG: manganese efflux pump MntP family protein [Coriobacteriales bacterium]|jgi:putative Mn2+ efflux pump MntP|nr:manganese efflux pump MntP family protein [Coriobacteriales bacterium]
MDASFLLLESSATSTSSAASTGSTRKKTAMGIFEIVLIGLALSMDAFAVTISNVFCFPDAPPKKLLAMPLLFGLFQGLMPLLGYFAGGFAADFIDAYAGIISLAILGFIGGKMIRDGLIALKADTSPSCPSPHDAKGLQLRMLLPQAIATSIDAFVVGVGFLAGGANIALTSPIVALTTAACCTVALLLGKRFGVLLGDRAQIAGGVVLVLIGLRAFLF